MGKGSKKGKTGEKLATGEPKLKQRRLEQAKDGSLNVSDLRLNSLRFTFWQCNSFMISTVHNAHPPNAPYW